MPTTTNPTRPRARTTDGARAAFRTVLLAISAALAAWLGAPVHAQDYPGAGGFTVSGGVSGASAESHAWVIVPASGTAGFGVIHIPPRGAVGPAGVIQDGRVETPARLEAAPERVAAWERTLYLVFPPEPTRPGERQRRVLTITATPTALGGGGVGGWEFDTTGRLNALASIPGDAPLLGLAGSPRGPAALLVDEASGGVELHLLSGAEWREVDLPDPLREGPSLASVEAPILVSLRDGLGVLVRDPEGPGLWQALLSGPGAADAAEPVAWTWVSLPLGGEGQAPFPVGPVFAIAGRLVFVQPGDDQGGEGARRGGALTVWSISAQDGRAIARVPDAPPGVALAPLDQSDRLIVFGLRPDESDAARAAARRPLPPGASPPKPRYDYSILEISAATGRVLYSGEPTSSPPLSPAEFRVLVLLLLGVTVVILVFVLRPTGPGGRGAPLILPPRTMLAEPGRRLAAALIDLAPALLLASRLTGVSLAETFSPAGALAVGDALALALDALAIAFAHTAAAEALFGRSLGKALVGCEVVRVVIARAGPDGELAAIARRPGFWRAAVRSLAKWTLAPAALAGIGGPDRRHLGDTMTGTVVIVRLHPDEPAPQT